MKKTGSWLKRNNRKRGVWLVALIFMIGATACMHRYPDELTEEEKAKHAFVRLR